MRKRLALVVAAALLSLPVTAPIATAQANVRMGGFLGFAFDSYDNWLLFGAEARLRGARMQYDVQPRVHYLPFDGGSSLQLDGNILFNMSSLVPQVQPYMGIGLALNRFSVDAAEAGADFDETNVGVNLISGLIVGVNPKWRPFLQFEYTIINDFANGANLAVGILFQISGTRF
ncbi:MAG: hypothetical protein ACT4P6_15260 [Gemmatimonadaceae bacterium]